MLDLELTTSRLQLRPAHENDARIVAELVADPLIHRNVARIPPGQSVDETAAFLRRVREGHVAGTDHVCAVELGGDLIGLVGLHRPAPVGLYELGYWIAPAHWGKGIATEAASALVGKAQGPMGLAAILSGHFIDNPASGRVLRKLGFMPCGRRPVWCAGRGEAVDHCDMVWIA